MIKKLKANCGVASTTSTPSLTVPRKSRGVTSRSIRKLINKLKNTIRNPYAWPGGYPIYVVLSDGSMLCGDCSFSEYKSILESTRSCSRDGWRLVDAVILWEGPEYCGHCGVRLQAAYE